MEDEILIHIVNWEKYNPRKGVESPRWFRLEHSLFDSGDFSHFTHGELVAWLYMLCQRSKKSDTTRIIIRPTHALRTAKIKRSTILTAINKLESLGVLEKYATSSTREIHTPNTQMRPTNDTARTDETNERTNKTKDKKDFILSVQKEGIPVGGIPAPVLTIAALQNHIREKSIERAEDKARPFRPAPETI